MKQKITTWTIKGMSKDSDPFVFNNQYSFENRNIRITGSKDSSLLGITNIRGDKPLDISLVIPDGYSPDQIVGGTPIGIASVNQYIVVFSCDSPYFKDSGNGVEDRIYRLDLNTKEVVILAAGDFNFNVDNPIEATMYYETEDIINVYWVDGKNQFRKLNILDPDIQPKQQGTRKYNTPYTSINNIDSKAMFSSEPLSVFIQKDYGTGSFPAGTIQYYITAYKKYGAETNIIWESPLYYMSPKNRGEVADKIVANSFILSINVSEELSKYFDNLRIYSTQRTSINGDVAAYLVKEVSISGGAGNYKVVDTGTAQETIDPTEILYKTSEPISPSTFEQKDGRLFIGNVELIGEDSGQLKNILSRFQEVGLPITTFNKKVPYYAPDGIYPYESNLDLDNQSIKGFKEGNSYLFGLQFQRKTLDWTPVIPICLHSDSLGHNTYSYEPLGRPHVNFDDDTITIPQATIDLDSDDIWEGNPPDLSNYIAVRAVMAEPAIGHNRVRLQGVVNPTLYNIRQRSSNLPYGVSSWSFRPMGEANGYDTIDTVNTNNRSLIPAFTVTSGIQNKVSIKANENAEIQNSVGCIASYAMDQYSSLSEDIKNLFSWELNTTNYYIDQNIIDIYSPDINDNTIPGLEGKFQVRIVGVVPFTSYNSSYIVQTSSVQADLDSPGLLNIPISGDNINYDQDWLRSRPLWKDGVRGDTKGGCIKFQDFPLLPYRDFQAGYITYMWHRQGSLNNDRNIDNAEKAQTAVLNHKIFANLKYSYFTSYFKDGKYFNLSDISENNDGSEIEPLDLRVYNSNEATAISVDSRVYMGNIDTVMVYNLFKRDGENAANTESTAFVENGGYPIVLQDVNGPQIVYGFEGATAIARDYVYGVEPVPIKTKSIPHIVTSLPIKRDTSPGIDTYTTLPSFIYSTYDMDNQPTTITLNRNLSTTGLTMSYDIQKAMDNTKGKSFELAVGIVTSDDLPKTEGEYLIWQKVEIGGGGQPSNLYNIWHVQVEIVDSSPSYTYLDDLETGEVISTNEGDLILTITGKVISPVPILIGGTCFVGEFYAGSREFSQGSIVVNVSSNPDSFEIDNKELSLIAPSSMKNLPLLYVIDIFEDLQAADIYGLQRKGEGDNPDEIAYDQHGLSALRWNVISTSSQIDISDTGCPRFSLHLSGDTYFQRWDCLKTYPFTEEDKNSVVEVGSFMLETYNNIQARTDRNRGKLDNTTTRPTNFDLYNEVYNQSQDFIAQQYLEEDLIKNNLFPTTVYWSLNKTIGEPIDTWMKINTISSLDLDGNKGRVTSINRLGNNLYVFQEHGISVILYNEQTQISTTSGVPVEIANSGLVNGKRYISDIVGCNNKWSIVNGMNTLYFIDSATKGIYKLSDSISSISSNTGFIGWSNLNIDDNIWSPNNRNSFLSGYDRTNGEVLFMRDSEALVYSEQLGQFTSFVDYRHTPYITTVDDLNIAVWTDNTTGNIKFSELEGGDDKSYGRYLGNYDYSLPPYEYSITLVANPEPMLDKIFDVLEFKGDEMELPMPDNPESVYKKANNDCPFSKVRIWNEYQDSGDILLNQLYGRPSSLKKKFRTWRVNNLRDNKGKGIKDRIRNPWCYIKLTGPVIKEDNVALQNWIHNIALHYFTD